MAIAMAGRGMEMGYSSRSMSPTLLIRISDGAYHMHRSFTNFDQAQTSAEAFARAGFNVSMISATGRFLMGFEPSHEKRPEL